MWPLLITHNRSQWLHALLTALIFSGEARNLGKGCRKLVLRKICPTRISEFVRLKKIGYGQEFFVRILNPDIKFFTFLLSESDFDRIYPRPNCPTRKKPGIGHQFLVWILTLSELSDPNLTRTRIFAGAT